MISKHSHEQSERGEGVEVVQNEPYEDPTYGAGQFTEKRIYLNKWVEIVVRYLSSQSMSCWCMRSRCAMHYFSQSTHVTSLALLNRNYQRKVHFAECSGQDPIYKHGRVMTNCCFTWHFIGLDLINWHPTKWKLIQITSVSLNCTQKKWMQMISDENLSLALYRVCFYCMNWVDVQGF